jgi:hypothetical protein
MKRERREERGLLYADVWSIKLAVIGKRARAQLFPTIVILKPIKSVESFLSLFGGILGEVMRMRA